MVRRWSEHCWLSSAESRGCALWSTTKPRGRRSPSHLSGAQGSDRRARQTCQSHQGSALRSGHQWYEPLRKNRRKQLDELHTGDGRPLPTHLKTQISRELDRLELLLEQITAVENERDTLLAAQKDSVAATATLIPAGAMLCDVKGIGLELAAVLWTEGLFRHFDNRRQVAAYAGLAPTPWQSGTIDHEQGVSKAGNPRLRTTMIQLSWLWLRHQPQSALSLWFTARVQSSGGRTKKSAIVALARNYWLLYGNM